MLKSIVSLYNINQTRILIFAVIFAVITNIATIFVLFEQLEHESLCDEQNDFNDFVEDFNPNRQIKSHINSIQQSIKNSLKSDQIIIPKPNKLDSPPDHWSSNNDKDDNNDAIKDDKTEKKNSKKQSESQLKQEKKDKEPSILDVRGDNYVIHEYPRSEMKATDWKYYLDHTLPKLSYTTTKCDPDKFVSHRLIQALRKWIFQSA